MATSIRLSRGGSKKRPYYRIVVADSRAPRDGKFIERIGSYNPVLPKGDEKRVIIDVERAKHWVAAGAQATDRVARFLDAAGVKERAARNNPKKAEPGQKAAPPRLPKLKKLRAKPLPLPPLRPLKKLLPPRKPLPSRPRADPLDRQARHPGRDHRCPWRGGRSPSEAVWRRG